MPTEYISLQEMKQVQCICPLSWSVLCNFTGDGKCNKKGVGDGVHLPPSPAQANFTLMNAECTPESGRYYSVYSVDMPFSSHKFKIWRKTFSCTKRS
jgi:hypothetical protein